MQMKIYHLGEATLKWALNLRKNQFMQLCADNTLKYPKNITNKYRVDYTGNFAKYKNKNKKTNM